MLGSLPGVGAAGGLTTTLAGCAGIDEKAAGPLMGLLGSTALGGLEGAVSSPSGEGETALQALITGAVPALQATIDGLPGDSAISAIVKPTLDGILPRLTTLGG